MQTRKGNEAPVERSIVVGSRSPDPEASVDVHGTADEVLTSDLRFDTDRCPQNEDRPRSFIGKGGHPPETRTEIRSKAVRSEILLRHQRYAHVPKGPRAHRQIEAPVAPPVLERHAHEADSTEGHAHAEAVRIVRRSGCRIGEQQESGQTHPCRGAEGSQS